MVRYSQNVMKNDSIWLKTGREKIVSNYIDFTKIAATVPLSTGPQLLCNRYVHLTWNVAQGCSDLGSQTDLRQSLILLSEASHVCVLFCIVKKDCFKAQLFSSVKKIRNHISI